MIFDYDLEKKYQQTVDVVDIGNACLRGTNDDLEDFYIITKTVMGTTGILKIGPVMPDTNMLLDGYTIEFKKIDYKEKSICKEINLFINDGKKGIKEIVQLQPEEVFPILPNIEESFNNL